MKEKAIVVGLGNLYMRDDGFGIRVAQDLKRKELGENVSVQEYPEMDLTLIATFHSASRIILVDAVKSGREPGTLSKLSFVPRKGDLSELPSLHSLELSDILDFASSTGILTCPVVIVGVEPKDDSPGDGLSPEVEAAIPKAIEAVIEELSTLA